VGVVKGLVVESSLKKDHPELSLVPLPDIETSLRQLLRVSWMPLSTTWHSLIHHRQTGVGQPEDCGRDTLYSRPGDRGQERWPLLASALDKALAGMTERKKRLSKTAGCLFNISGGSIGAPSARLERACSW